MAHIDSRSTITTEKPVVSRAYFLKIVAGIIGYLTVAETLALFTTKHEGDAFAPNELTREFFTILNATPNEISPEEYSLLLHKFESFIVELNPILLQFLSISKFDHDQPATLCSYSPKIDRLKAYIQAVDNESQATLDEIQKALEEIRIPTELLDENHYKLLKFSAEPNQLKQLLLEIIQITDLGLFSFDHGHSSIEMATSTSFISHPVSLKKEFELIIQALRSLPMLETAKTSRSDNVHDIATFLQTECQILEISGGMSLSIEYDDNPSYRKIRSLCGLTLRMEHQNEQFDFIIWLTIENGRSDLGLFSLGLSDSNLHSFASQDRLGMAFLIPMLNFITKYSKKECQARCI